MKKDRIILMALIFALAMTACVKSENNVLPKSGIVFATINGEDLYYDPVYCFKISNGYVSDDYNEVVPNTEMTYGEIELLGELAYLESDKLINDSENKVQLEKELRQQCLENNAYSQKMQEKIMETNGLTEEEYWQELEPYIKKYIIISEYSEEMSSNYFKENPDASDEALHAFYKEKLNILMEKYNAEYNGVSLQ